ncbi:MAG: AbrB/MazE/SpoVT family DNA-binding domain-containing protein [Planctomycetes bacterium]|nr:AbrB/MazE/SpoVT family DNA-binding domain-containing protein [Planctomycetota bacterium]
MAKVTAKLQVTIPKALASQYGIVPGDEITWQAAGDAIRIVPAAAPAKLRPLEERLALFRAMLRRQREREERGRRRRVAKARGWTREELYDRGRPR